MGIIERIHSLQIDRISAQVREADATRFRGLVRLVEDWRSGLNRFNQPGEALFIAIDGESVVGVCGLNRDPYLGDPIAGRIRHLYVAVDHRRRGIGSRLVRTIMASASGHFARLRLRTDSADADAFYRSLGFMAVTGEPACSHQLLLIDEIQPSIPLVRR
jgi:ribosomal protein S18 acetylase RimI-like enzyme